MAAIHARPAPCGCARRVRPSGSRRPRTTGISSRRCWGPGRVPVASGAHARGARHGALAPARPAVRRLGAGARCTPRCWTKGRTTARNARCTACSPLRARGANGARSGGVRATPRRNCSPPGPTSSGAGTSPSSRARRSGRTSTSTSCSTCSVATSSAGWWRGASPQCSPSS